MATAGLTVGDRVNWRQQPRGGYGFTRNVAGVVTALGPTRVQIRVAQRLGGEWVQQLRWVPEVDVVEGGTPA